MCFGEPAPDPVETCAAVANACVAAGGDVVITAGEGTYDSEFGRFILESDGELRVCRVTCENIPTGAGTGITTSNDGDGGGNQFDPGQ